MRVGKFCSMFGAPSTPIVRTRSTLGPCWLVLATTLNSTDKIQRIERSRFSIRELTFATLLTSRLSSSPHNHFAVARPPNPSYRLKYSSIDGLNHSSIYRLCDWNIPQFAESTF